MSKLSTFDSISAKSISTPQLIMNKANVSQTTSNTSGVTASALAGVITTMSQTVATQGSSSFIVTHPKVNVNSVILANIVNYSGNGLPRVHVNTITSGNFSIVIGNAHVTAPLSAAVKIAYQIL
jgi:hypothetical protein